VDPFDDGELGGELAEGKVCPLGFTGVVGADERDGAEVLLSEEDLVLVAVDDEVEFEASRSTLVVLAWGVVSWDRVGTGAGVVGAGSGAAGVEPLVVVLNVAGGWKLSVVRASDGFVLLDSLISLVVVDPEMGSGALTGAVFSLIFSLEGDVVSSAVVSSITSAI